MTWKKWTSRIISPLTETPVHGSAHTLKIALHLGVTLLGFTYCLNFKQAIQARGFATKSTATNCNPLPSRYVLNLVATVFLLFHRLFHILQLPPSHTSFSLLWMSNTSRPNLSSVLTVPRAPTVVERCSHQKINKLYVKLRMYCA